MKPMRLQKFLSAAGVCSRRKGETFILAGRVTVNGERVTVLGTRVDPDTDRVRVDGRPATLKADHVYIVLHKPEGYVTSCDHPGEDIVLDLVDIQTRLFPVGRLDKESTGLLLLTDDGRIHHRLSHPSFDHEKEYDVTVAKPLSEGVVKKLARGVALRGKKTRPAKVRRLSAKRFNIILQEGRNRQIRRMVAKVGNEVVGLKRVRVAHIRLNNLKQGRWRHLSDTERARLLEIVSGTADCKKI
ncbi:MAG: rRNA pseudouridine synthase [Desulfobacterales bacterium]|nr:rRNA pseudouridine synthase [Desulfobacterales bacterium]